MAIRKYIALVAYLLCRLCCLTSNSSKFRLLFMCADVAI